MIAAGAYADVIAVAADPLQDVSELEHVAFVMHNGSVIQNRQGGPMSTRRDFFSLLAVPGLVLGASPAARALTRTPAFEPDPQADDAAVFAAARQQFLIPAGVAYCNTGTLGASPREVVEALNEGVLRLETELADWPYEHPDGEPLTGYQPLLDVRGAMGQFINAPAADIALTQNATMGMNFLANGLDLAAGDEVVSTDQEHGGCISPWRLLAKRRGIVVKELPLEPALAGGPDAIVKLFESAMTPRTKVVMFSHITSGLGVRLPARELCALAHSHGALALVDGAQAVGQIQVDVRSLDCDAYVGSPHKWMMAPKGTGFLYLRHDVQDRVWTTLASYQWDNHADGAFRFMQYGTGSVPVVQGLTAALRLHRQDRHGADRAVGRKPHEAPARRACGIPGRSHRVAHRSEAHRGHHDLSRQRREGQGAAGRVVGEARARSRAKRRAGSPVVGPHVREPERRGRDPRRHPGGCGTFVAELAHSRSAREFDRSRRPIDRSTRLRSLRNSAH